MTSIIIASPHARNDQTERLAREALTDIAVLRVRSREELAAALQAGRPDWVFFPHWSWKIPEPVFESHRCVIFHMTDLPYGRGGSPLQNLILRGHKATKLSAIRCVAELDAGPVYLKRDLDLSGTAEDILRRAAGEIGAMIVQMVREEPQATAQQGDVVRFERRKPEQSRIPEGLGAEALYDFIRMLDADGYPHANMEAAGCLLEFREARLEDGRVEARVSIRVKE
jgi:methionyl-tRNA formyltransferase